ncbi:hypothetical protein WJX81_005070 [Elliptochloris bilobata]|uniref:Uncharacterized protein n=1 Tax=Elliptochloris bilobata TaxID=381761 RepID=A0AAW1S9T4_9CHLO
MLLLGDSRTFFMLYRIVADAGLRAYHLDRDGALSRSRALPPALADAAAAAAAAADCVLATASPALNADADAGGDWCLAVNSSAASVVRSRRGLYEALLCLEREGAVVVERDMLAADLALSASTCLSIWPEASLQGSGADVVAALSQAVCEQVQLLGASFARCLLVVEGAPAFLAQVWAHAEGLYTAAEREGVALKLLTSSGPAKSEEVITRAAKSVSALLRGTDACVILPEQPSDRERALGAYPALNPFSAARLAAIDCPLQELLALDSCDQERLAEALPDVPASSLRLFYQQVASAGVRATTPHGTQPVSWTKRAANITKAVCRDQDAKAE